MTDITNAEFIADARGPDHVATDCILFLHEALDRLEKLADENERLKSRLARYDDQRPITEAGLREMGVFTESYNNREGWKFDIKFRAGKILIEVNFNDHATVYLVSEGFSFGLWEIKTIGQLAHLLDALGVSKESNAND